MTEDLEYMYAPSDRQPGSWQAQRLGKLNKVEGAHVDNHAGGWLVAGSGATYHAVHICL